MNRRFPKLKTTVTYIFDRFSDEKTCCDFLFGVRFANGFACPYCGDSRFGKIELRGLYRCKGCRKQISPTSGTFMHGTHIKLRIWIKDNMHHLAKSGRWLGGTTPIGYRSVGIYGGIIYFSPAYK